MTITEKNIYDFIDAQELEEFISSNIRLTGDGWINQFSWKQIYFVGKNEDLKKVFLKYFLAGGKSGKRIEKVKDDRTKNFILGLITEHINQSKK